MMLYGQGKHPGLTFPFTEGDALALPFADGTFDAACSGFMMRNVTDIRCLLCRTGAVVKPGGRVVCLEITLPRTPVFGAIPILLLQTRAPPGRHHQRPASKPTPTCLTLRSPSRARSPGGYHGRCRAARRTLSSGDAGHSGRPPGNKVIEQLRELWPGRAMAGLKPGPRPTEPSYRSKSMIGQWMKRMSSSCLPHTTVLEAARDCGLACRNPAGRG